MTTPSRINGHITRPPITDHEIVMLLRAEHPELTLRGSPMLGMQFYGYVERGGKVGIGVGATAYEAIKQAMEEARK